MIQPHLIQVGPFRFDKLLIESNKDFQPSEINTKELKLHFNFNLQGHLNDKFKKRITVELKINNKKQDFIKSPYRIDIKAGLEIRFPKDTPEDVMCKNIINSGFHLVWTSLRNQLALATSISSVGELIIPTLDFTDAMNDFEKIVKNHFKTTCTDQTNIN